MSNRDLIKRLMAGDDVERTGFWLGNPHDDTWPILHAHFGTSTEEELRVALNDDVRWICPQMYDDIYRDPTGRRDLFGTGVEGGKHASRGPLADAETPADLETFPWPNPDYLHFDACLADLRNAGDVYRLSGFWTCFYHNIMDLLGMEEYMVKMYTHPDVVRVRELLGPHVIISPSHEALLPNVPPENVAAMAEAAIVAPTLSR